MARSRSAPAPAASRASAAASRPRPAASSTPAAAPAAPAAAPAAAAPAAAAPAASSWWGSSKPAAPAAPVPAPAAPAPPPAVQTSSGGGIMSGLIGSVVQGAAMGTGSAIAHRAVDSMFGPRETKVVHEHVGAPEAPQASAPMATEGPCADKAKAFADCMAKQNGDMAACQYYFDAMQQCRVMSA